MIQNSRAVIALKFLFHVSLISLVPYLVFFFVVVPCSDDIFYHNYAQGKTVSEFMVHHYSTWTGRYFSNLMMAVNPYTLFSNPTVYPLMVFSIFSVFSISLFFLIQILISKLEPNLNSQKRGLFTLGPITLMVTTITLSLFLHKMPRTSDSLYWFAGASSHLLPMSLVLIAVTLYLRNLFRVEQISLSSVASIVAISFISFLVSGSNETLALQWLFSLSFAILYSQVVFQRWEKSLFFPLLIALIGFGILYFAPGNAVRAKELKGGHDLILLLFKPWGLIIETTVRYLSVSLLLIVFLFFPVLKKINARLPSYIKEPKSRILLGLFGLGLFALTFVPSVWTMGGLPPRRVLNNTYLEFLVMGAVLLIVFADRLTILNRWSERLNSLSATHLKIITTVSLLLLFNHFYAWKDLVFLPSYLKSQEKREMLVKSGQKKDLVLPNLEHFPTTFFYEDITSKTDDYRNVVFAEFFGLSSVRLAKDYTD